MVSTLLRGVLVIDGTGDPGVVADVLMEHGWVEAVSGLPAMIRRMTSEPAERFRLGRRGQVTRGYGADVVVFGPHTVVEPLLAPKGVRHVSSEERPSSWTVQTPARGREPCWSQPDVTPTPTTRRTS
jgi:N-acyl-D-aspartate/D-glutamate deacylase